MIYHLYDDNRQHLAMSESLPELKNVALQAFQQDDLPYAFIRWSDAGGKRQEFRVTMASLMASGRAQAQSNRQVHVARDGAPQPSARQRANLLVGTVIVVLLLYLTSEIASMIMEKPWSETVWGF